MSCQLEVKYAKEIKDVDQLSPERSKYQACLNTTICFARTAQTTPRTREIRGQKTFLRYLQPLTGTIVLNQLLRILWLGRFPAQMQVILATQMENRLEKVAEQADKILEVTCRVV
ncbi:PREDICTED: uncharacterized protein LOC105457971 [Wasmannia auropunctata]|uniref:uncharacterized protein LOC105457971 n=1 Tax=Wasmannia auropunctata TaxID=64793 RepID=UPI0005EFC6E6|nr:PREDICTED: uncharacterized protein LOC105457971 [Wasmannia auropunctata]